MVEADVLVVGCGPAGLTAAMAMARSGIRVLAVSRHARLAPTPRAHVTNQRSFEILREFGLEEQALAASTDYARMPDQIFMRSLTGEEFGRIKGVGQEGSAHIQASPCALADLPQHLLEPILFGAALRLGAVIRFETELTSFTQDGAGVTACLADHVTGEKLIVRAQYMIGADGGNSVVADALRLPFEGPGVIGGSLNIQFESDLAPFIAHRPGLLFYLARMPEDAGGAGLGVLRCIKPWTSWLMIKGYAQGQETRKISNDEAAEVIRDYLGIPDLELKITGVYPWPMNALCATAYQQGRIFCAGDAVHRHVPSNGLGSNTAIQDAHNLAWKLNLVLQGKANARLLDTYSDERAPVGLQVVHRATKSLHSYTPILEAIGVLDPGGADASLRNMAEITADTQKGEAQRAMLQTAIRDKVYEFQARGVELNQMYRSSAILDEGQQPQPSELDLELFFRPTTCPGARLPHAWVQRDGHNLSTLDLVGRGRFTVLTGIGGDTWVAAAAAASSQLGIKIVAIAIGPGCAYSDLYFEWAERREIAEDGCLLIRPDGHIAWRCHRSLGRDGTKRLVEALASILAVASSKTGL